MGNIKMLSHGPSKSPGVLPPEGALVCREHPMKSPGPLEAGRWWIQPRTSALRGDGLDFHAPDKGRVQVLWQPAQGEAGRALLSLLLFNVPLSPHL